MSPSESDFVDDIIGDKLPTHTAPLALRDDFSPWHRVRKEFIRRHQWNELAIRMIKRRWGSQLQNDETHWSLEDDPSAPGGVEVPGAIAVDRPLSCLVIPGQDLLDVRAFWRDMRQFDCFIRYLGFNEGHSSDQSGTRLSVANNAVTSLHKVCTDSFVANDRFESIAKTNSQALRYLKQYGPYHIVNLDLCGSMCPNTVKSTTAYYDALVRLFAYQSEFQKSEWLLFVTTMVEPAVIDSEGFKKLCKATRANFDSHKQFADEVEKLLPPEAFQGAESPVNLSVLDNEQIIRLFGVALGKWILALCQSAKPQSTVAMRRSFRYVVNENKGAVMLSLAFEIKPNVSPPVDNLGIAELKIPATKYPDERECAVKIATSVGSIRDVDELLAKDRPLWEQLRDAQASLLEAAGFSREGYLRWTDQGETVSQEELL